MGKDNFLNLQDVVWVGGKLISLDSLKSAAKVPNEVKGLKCLMNDYFGDYIRGKSMADLSANDKEACKEIIRKLYNKKKLIIYFKNKI